MNIICGGGGDFVDHKDAVYNPVWVPESRFSAKIKFSDYAFGDNLFKFTIYQSR